MLGMRCPICDSADVSYCCSNTDRRRGLSGEWNSWKCGECSVLFENPLPSPDELRDYYTNYAGSDRITMALSTGSRSDTLRRLYHHLSGDVDPRDFVTISPALRVLDYGCGQAPYLNYFRSRGVRISGAEVDPSVVGAYRAAGIDVAQVENLDRIPFPAEEFDIVYLMQVMEHIAKPHSFLSEVRRVLKPSGVLYLAMPNASSIWRKRFGPHWVSGWFSPFHVFQYGVESLGRLASAHGFTIVEARSSTPESWFRLNLKAFFRPRANQLDLDGPTWLDLAPFRFGLMVVLRLLELFQAERDCLVLQLTKQDEWCQPLSGQ